ncbi:MAG TPA: hypothetical protein VLQ45_13595 [Thermoanaerobaculia bacterium]|nr:hypothetical protein [Thermoanaerobaculia bacterium]
MKRLILATALLAGTFGVANFTVNEVNAQPPNCAVVLCLVCPEGTVASPTPGNCCRCVKP